MISTSDLAAALVEHEGAVPETAALAAGLVLDAVQLDATGAPVVSLKDLIARHKVVFPSMFAMKKAMEAEPQAPVLPHGFALKPSPAQRTAQAVAQASAENPWSTATRNVTFQALLEARDPALAAQLKASAR